MSQSSCYDIPIDKILSSRAKAGLHPSEVERRRATKNLGTML